MAAFTRPLQAAGCPTASAQRRVRALPEAPRAAREGSAAKGSNGHHSTTKPLSPLHTYIAHVVSSMGTDQPSGTLSIPPHEGGSKSIDKPVAALQASTDIKEQGRPAKPAAGGEALKETLRTLAQLEERSAALRQEMDEVNARLAATARALANQAVEMPQVSAASPMPLPPASAPEPQPTPRAEPAGVTEHSTSCVVQHPGAQCCTETNVTKDAVGKTCVITMRTVTRCVNDTTAAAAFSADDLAALATQALLGSAAELSRSHTRALTEASLSAARVAAHRSLVEVLETGRVVEVERVIPSSFDHASYVVQLEDAKGKRRLRALFKPRVEGDADGWHRVPVEAVAYRLNLALGMDAVPPVGYRWGNSGDDALSAAGIEWSEGAFLYFCDDCQQLQTFPDSAWGVRKDVLLSDTRILDVLLHNSDRHHGHFLMGRHWADGSWQGSEWVGAHRPVLIDHAAGFRTGAYVSMLHENAFQTGPVRAVSATTYLHLRYLDAPAIAAKFSGLLSEREMREMLQRRNQVLHYLDRLVEEQGYSATVVQGVQVGAQ